MAYVSKINGYDVKDKEARDSIAEINNNVSNLDSSVKNQSELINSLSSDNDNNKTNISSLSSSLETTNNNVNEVVTNLETTNTNIENLSNKVNENLKLLNKKKSHKPMLIAHRGANLEAPENTIPAFRIAKQQGYDAIEFDIHFTSDGHPVVIHNDTIDEMTNGSGSVSGMTLETLKTYYIDNGSYIDEYTNLEVPTLEEVLNFVNANDIIPVIELKFSYNESHINTILDYLKKFNLIDRAIVISQITENLEKLRELNSNIKILVLTHLTEDYINYCKTHNFGISVHWGANDVGNNSNTIDLIKLAHENNVDVSFWGITNNDNYSFAAYVGGDYITLDNILHGHYKIDSVSPSNIYNTFYSSYNGVNIPSKYMFERFIKDEFIPATISTSGNKHVSEAFRFYAINRAVKLKLFPIKSDSVAYYTPNSDYRVSISCFDSNLNFTSDQGWFSNEETSKTNFPSDTKWGVMFGCRYDNTDLTEHDLNELNKIINYVKY